MATMYSRSELETKKKDGLQLIVKSLGLKGRRLKAELVDQILENQSEVGPPASWATVPHNESHHEDLLASAAMDIASAIKADGVSKKALSRGSAAASDTEDNTSILDVDTMLLEDHLDSDLSVSEKCSRLDAEGILQQAAKQDITAAADEHSTQHRLKRSNTFNLDLPASTSSTTDLTTSPQVATPAKGRPKRRRSVSPQSEEQSPQAGKRARKKTRVMTTVAATLPRRGRRGTVIPQPEARPRRQSRDISPAAPSAQPQPAEEIASEAHAAEGRPQLRSNSSQVLLNSPLATRTVSAEPPSKRTILTPKRTIKTPSRVSNTANRNLSNSNPPTPISAVAARQSKVSSQTVNSPATVPAITPQTSAETDVAVEAPVSARRLFCTTANEVKPASALPSIESLCAVASPRLSAVSAQGRRLSSAKRLSSASSLSNRVVPTLAQPVFTIGKHDKKDQEKDGSHAGGQVKSSIPRFMAYAQKIHKMPNFKRIHEKAFNNMQNLDEFVSKKKQLSNSVQKTSRPSASFVPSVVSTKGMKLNFSDKSPVLKFGAGLPTPGRQQTPRFGLDNKSARLSSVAATVTPRRSCGPKTVERIFSARKMGSSAAFASSVKENVRPARTPRESLATPFSVASRPAVVKTIQSVARTKSSQPEPTKPNTVSSGIQNRAAFKNRAELHGPGKTYKSNPSVVGVAAGVGAGISRLPSKLPQYKPYKGPLRSPGTSRAALKNLANKRPTIASREDRRERNKEYVKGVRTNKRFQLQMERRGVAP